MIFVANKTSTHILLSTDVFSLILSEARLMAV